MNDDSVDVICSSCGATVAPGAFCRQCGEPLDAPPRPGDAGTADLPRRPSEETAARAVGHRPSRRHRTFSIIALLAATVSATGAVVWAFSTRESDSSSTDTSEPPVATQPALNPPVGATRLPVTGGSLLATRDQPVPITVATCPGLLAVVTAEQCVELDVDHATYAMTLTSDGPRVSVNAYQFLETAESLTAVRQLTGTVDSASTEPGNALEIGAATAQTADGAAFALFTTRQGQTTEGSVEFVAPDRDGVLGPVGVIAEGVPRVAIYEATILVASDRSVSEGRDVAGVLLTTVYPVPSAWVGVAELLDPPTASQRIASGRPVQPDAFVRVQAAPPETAPTTTLEPAPASTTTTTQPLLPPVQTTTTSGPNPADPRFAQVECNGGWITVVASRPISQVQAAVAANPDARVIKNDESCASLRPYFESGTYAGEVIYVVFYGPFTDQAAAQRECINRGKFTMDDCYAAPLTPNPGDRTSRFPPAG